jgi:capsular exopolysaccharide synthesis family protein
MALGMFTGMSVGLAYVLIQDRRTNQNVRYPGESMMRLGVPELAVIASTEALTGKVKGLAFRKVPASLDSIENAGGDDDFRSLLASIFFSGAQGKEPKVVVVSSCAPQDGKTTVASNLSVALARAGKSVLLVDGDLRRPQIHNIFGLPNANGLGNLLQTCTQPVDAQRAVLNSSVPGLSVLTSGSCTAAPADLLFDPHLRELITSFRDHYDMVIVDSPPMMRIPDARLLGRNADAMILVVRANRTPRNSILLARHRLALDHTRLLGIVLNDCDSAAMPYQYEG